ncbi:MULTISPECIES: HNH endonuclease signature motif containing protein [unclassified Knoellia]|uniref:HNH endonuclease signature motif containing protein n=1 Tax=Knoellia altitudinis TaxID=3404795 RepID=UPI003606059E
MDQATGGDIARLRAVLEGARDALASDAAGAGPLGEVLARLSASELAEFMGLLDDVKARAGAAQVRVVAEAAHRGEFTSARRGVGSVHAWVREHAPSLQQAGAGQVAQLAQEVACSVPGGLWSTAGPGAGAYADPERPEGVVWSRVVTGEVGAGLALTALKEMAKLADHLRPDAVPTVAGAILDHGVRWGCAEARRLRPHLLAMFGVEGEFDDAQQRLRKAAYLTSPRVNDADITEYRLGLTPAQAATVEAAIGPLSQPAPNDVTGERDLRPAEQRRAEALAALCGRVAAEDGAQKPPGGASTTLHVTMTLQDLIEKLRAQDSDNTHANSNTDAGTDAAGASAVSGAGCGRVMVSRAQATKLSPAVVRQLACDADVIPVVLGAEGEVLDLGRAVRLFTRAQRRALWHRDGGCTYPGCDVPAGWAKAHHLLHWVDGGPSDLANAALLCQRHHSHVHDQRLIATVHPPDEHGRSVTWDLTPGSYDRELPARLTTIRRAHATKRTTEQQGLVEHVQLDTGPPDPWANEPPAHLVAHWVDEWRAEHDAEDWDLTA